MPEIESEKVIFRSMDDKKLGFFFILTLALAGFDFANAGGWSLWGKFRFNLLWSFLNFWNSAIILNKVSFNERLFSRQKEIFKYCNLWNKFRSCFQSKRILATHNSHIVVRSKKVWLFGLMWLFEWLWLFG